VMVDVLFVRCIARLLTHRRPPSGGRKVVTVVGVAALLRANNFPAVIPAGKGQEAN
jgi:hypothetical protein